MNEVFLPLPLEQWENLARHKFDYCVSIYVPMYKSGKEQNEGLSQAHLKASIKKSAQSLLAHGMDPREIDIYLQPISDLLPDYQLWRNPSDGLVIFLCREKGLVYYQIPIKFNPYVYVSDHFYLVPLTPLFEFDSSFYLLALSQDHVKLYLGGRYRLEDLYVNEFAPERLEEAVGFDFEQKMLQFRSGQAVHSAGSFHGRGEGKDDSTNEISYFFREINKGVNKVIEKKNSPLVLACVDWLYPIYREVNSYPNLFPKHLSGDPEYMSNSQLKDEAWSLLSDFYSSKREQKKELYTEVQHTAKASHQISDIIPAAIQGRIDTLFIRKGDKIYGTFNSKNNCIILDSEKDKVNVSLINFAAINTLTQGGNVFMMETEDMPYKKRPLNAIFRY